jgi:diguanylate cyclase (GGDEF)-like protein/PAS domain S-box-containing protein
MTEFAPTADPLRSALLESRQRWQDLVAISADLAFETDSDGRFVFVSPDQVMGWAAQDLLGRPSALLLTEAGAQGFNPFAAERPLRNRRVWLRGAASALRWMSFSVAPLYDAAGAFAGVRGVARDVTELDRTESGMARALRRAELVDRMVWEMRTEVTAPRMMIKALHALSSALGADGAMVIESQGTGGWEGDGALLYEVGGDLAALRALAAPRMGDAAERPVILRLPAGHSAVMCAMPTRFDGGATGTAGVILWRQPGHRGWDGEDLTLLAGAGAKLSTVLEHGAIQREVARQARTDGLTGMANRAHFAEELSRRLDRLDQEGLPGTLMLVDLDDFRRLNEHHGPEAGDAELRVLAALLRMATRPCDLCARLGADTFALWLDGMDELAAAERAERVRRQGASALRSLDGQQASLSLGIASRWPGSGLDGPTLMRRANVALAAVKQMGGDGWRVWHGEDSDER